MENIFTKETKYRLVSSILFLIFAFVSRAIFVRIGFLVAGVIGILTCNNQNKKAIITAMIILISLCALQLVYGIVD
jgi:membrane-anchored glycerophosphoryl diester phosphodiesterase (GDPDase)